MLDSGALNRKSSSIDLLDDLDLGFLNVGSLGDTPKDEVGMFVCCCCDVCCFVYCLSHLSEIEAHVMTIAY